MNYLATSTNEAISCNTKFILEAQESGKKFTTGTVTFATTSAGQIVTHNLGSVPSVFIMYPIDTPPESETDEAKSKVYGSTSIAIYPAGTRNGQVYQGNSNTGRIVWTNAENFGNTTTNTETTIQPSYYRGNYRYVANFRYGWIAIE